MLLPHTLFRCRLRFIERLLFNRVQLRLLLAGGRLRLVEQLIFLFQRISMFVKLCLCVLHAGNRISGRNLFVHQDFGFLLCARLCRVIFLLRFALLPLLLLHYLLSFHCLLALSAVLNAVQALQKSVKRILLNLILVNDSLPTFGFHLRSERFKISFRRFYAKLSLFIRNGRLLLVFFRPSSKLAIADCASCKRQYRGNRYRVDGSSPKRFRRIRFSGQDFRILCRD